VQKAFAGVGNLNLAWVGWEPEVSSLSSRIHVVVPGMEKFKGKDVTFVSEWLTSQGLEELYLSSVIFRF